LIYTINKTWNGWLVDTFEQHIAAGEVFISDFQNVIPELANFGVGDHAKKESFIHVYKKAIVKGIEFNGRGTDFAENEVMVEDNRGHQSNSAGMKTRVMVRKTNVVADCWSDKNQIDAWFRMTDFYQQNTTVSARSVSKNSKTARRKNKSKASTTSSSAHVDPNPPQQYDRIVSRQYVGQFNYFFRIRIKSDRLLNNLPFASAVLRKPTFDKSRHHNFISGEDKDSYYPHKQFVSLNYIDSTAIAISALDEQSFPLLNPKVRSKWILDKSYLLISANSLLDRLYFIELHPERLIKKVVLDESNKYVDVSWEMTTDYRTVLHDEDHTKTPEEQQG